MLPDRSNYEIWFIDWLDGKLSEEQEEQLCDFLSLNPDLHEELRTISPVSLKPQNEFFARKSDLIRKPSDLTLSQFDYLCIADLENDLSPDGVRELEEAMANDPARKQEYSLIHRLKLVPPEISYKYKNRLRRITPFQKVIRFSFIGISAAAAITLFLVLYTPQRPELQTNSSLMVTAETMPGESEPVPENRSPQEILPLKVTEAPSPTEPDTKVASLYEGSDTAETMQVSELNTSEPDVIFRTSLAKVPLPFSAVIEKREIINNNLIAFTPDIMVPLFDDGRSNVNRFLARVFHEKIMRDTTAGDRPVRAYDIAEAGINGFNKLFRAELALTRNTDENGEVKSVYFSSRLLKFNAPVRKADTFQ